MRYYLREILAGKVNLAEAPNGKEGLAWLAKNKADLIISNIMMPKMDGRTFITEKKRVKQPRGSLQLYLQHWPGRNLG
jgi:CheY-like chemotaxis protein